MIAERDAAECDLASHASELYLAARWDKAKGNFVKAGREYRDAADLWQRAAVEIGLESPSEGIRQLINAAAALVEAGDIPRGDSVARVVDRRIAEAKLAEPVRQAMAGEWRKIVERLDAIRLDWQQDRSALKDALAPTGDMRKLAPEVAQKWLEKYPGFSHSHYIAARVAVGRGDLTQAKRHMEDALVLDPENLRYRAIHLHLLPETTPPDLALNEAREVYHRFKGRSPRLDFMYAVVLIELAHKGAFDRREALESAALAVKMALAQEPNDLSLTECMNASLLRQYCEWRLGLPGVSSPFGKRWFYQRGEEILEIELPAGSGAGPGREPTGEEEERFLLKQMSSVA